MGIKLYIYISIGVRLEFRCKIESNPAPKVQWRKGQWLSIDDGGRYIVKKDPDIATYTMAIKVRI